MGLENILKADPLVLGMIALLIAVLAMGAPQLARLGPLVARLRGKKVTADEAAVEAGAQPALAAPANGEASDMSAALLQTIRKEAQHSANSAVAGAYLKINALEKRQDELRELAYARHTELKGEIDEVRRMVEEIQPMKAEVAKLATAVDYMRQEQKEFREDVREGLREIRNAIASTNRTPVEKGSKLG